MMKVLITGAGGQAGWELQRTAPVDLDLTALHRTDLDITDQDAVMTIIRRNNPDLVINAAAYTAVDKAEEEADLAYAVNGDGAANIAKACKETGVRLLHISTDFVFDGNKAEPYLPEDEPKPMGVYGASKLQGEKSVMAETMGTAVVLRTAWVYSIHGSNFVKTMLRLMAEKDELNVVTDQIGTPTWARELAKVIWLIAEKKKMQGIYHWTDGGVASWYDFALAIQEEALGLDLLKKTIRIRPIGTAEYPTPAKRPAYSVLDKTSIIEELGYKPPHWRESLQKMLRELRAEGLRIEC
jgi:dTDP-4-dehydrorhamnose reductase